MPTQLFQLFQDLNKENLRIRRPSKFIFFCGGAMNNEPKAACSLRHYLLSDRQIEPRLKAKVVLAEKAVQLYRNTSYTDLITFEEDIARISAMVLLIAESPGSLAELGAFAAIDSIRSNLAVLIQTEVEKAQSFIRYGPVEKIINEDRLRVGVFPWKLNKRGVLIKASAKPHVANVVGFINDLISKTPNEEQFEHGGGIKIFMIILWVLHLSQAIAITELHEFVSTITSITMKELKDKLFCMQLAGWIDEYPYGGKNYWYSVSDIDPFTRYSFAPGVRRRPDERKKEVSTEIYAEIKVPRQV